MLQLKSNFLSQAFNWNVDRDGVPDGAGNIKTGVQIPKTASLCFLYIVVVTDFTVAAGAPNISVGTVSRFDLCTFSIGPIPAGFLVKPQLIMFSVIGLGMTPDQDIIVNVAGGSFATGEANFFLTYNS